MTEKPGASWWQTLSGWIGKRRVRGREVKARRAEARGDLARAAELYLKTDAREEALRVIVARAESVLDPAERLRLWSLASSLALDEERRELRSRVALLKLELFQTKRMVLTSHELSRLGSELLALDKPRLAATAYQQAGDLEGETRALVEAGAIGELEAAFDAHHERQSRQRAEKQVLQRAHDLAKVGRRRACLSLIGERAKETEVEPNALRRRILDTRLVSGSFVLQTSSGARRYVLGTRVALGRGPAPIRVASPAVSREHLVFELRQGRPTVLDVSKNGTTLAGVLVAAPLNVEARLELVLGGHVEVTIERESETGLDVTVLGESYRVPFGEICLESGALRLADDAWVEFAPSTHPLYLNGFQIGQSVELCDGDELTAEPGGSSLLTVRR